MSSKMGTESESLLEFFVNGEKVTIRNPKPELCLLDYLRDDLKLCGSKLGCGEGGCGACTVLVSRHNNVTQKMEHNSVVSCLVPVCSLHGAEITTVEGVGSTKTKLHPIQESLAQCNGTQCGYCSPGMVMSMYSLLKTNNQPQMVDIEDAIKGNLCRCTGYRPIIESFRSFSKQAGVTSYVGLSPQNGPSNGGEVQVKNGGVEEKESRRKFCLCFGHAKVSDVGRKQLMKFEDGNGTWYTPYSLDKLLELKSKHPTAVLVGGNTSVGLRMRFQHESIPIMLSILNVPELNTIKMSKMGVEVGAAVSLTELETFLQRVVKEEPETKTGVFTAILGMLPKFTGRQIKNMSTVGGTIAIAMSTSDTIPILMASRSVAKVHSKGNSRDIVMDQMYLDHPTVLEAKEVITGLTIPFIDQNQYVAHFKQTNRQANIRMCAKVSFQANTNHIQDIQLAFTGVDTAPLMATRAMNKLRGMKWNDSMLATANVLLEEEFPMNGLPENRLKYQRLVITGFFFKYYCMVLQFLKKKQVSVDSSLVKRFDIDILTATDEVKPIRGTQVFQPVPEDQPNEDAVNRPIPHRSCEEHTSGEAVYVDDMPKFENELYLGIVHSSRAHAKLVSINTEKALAMDGVYTVVTADDIPEEQSMMGIYKPDERAFAKDEVTCVGQMIAAVVAKDKATAQAAARLVEVQYEDIKPAIFTIEDAIKADSFFEFTEADIDNGDVDSEIPTSDHVIEGKVHLHGQKHFYMETQSVIAVPKGEKGEMEVYASIQMIGLLQGFVAKALGVPSNRVVCKVKRIGGGFGGKGTRCMPLAVACAIAAKKTNRAVRLKLDRHEDMIMVGARHPFLGIYRVGVNTEGKINALDLKLYSDSGNSYDLSTMIMELAVDAIDNCYNMPHLRVVGRCCRTNMASNTAFRGFGGLQGFTVIECIIDHIAVVLGLNPMKVREINFYNEGDLTPHHQPLTRFTIPECWSECIKRSNYEEHRAAVDNFNSQNRWKKRGLAIVPLKFGVGFIPPFMNQGGALIQVYTDGTILIAHGGVEMGQGLNTKCMQVASRVLQVSIDKMHVNDNATDKVPNSVPTSASSGSDLFCAAVQNACEILKERLEPYKQNNPDGTWEQWVGAAYFDRVNLSVTGFYKTPDIGYNPETKTGLRYNYFTYGVGSCEVEIDCLSGDHQVLRSDIVMDVGQSLNPTIDIGQVEGGFTQGYGYYLTEDIVYNSDGLMTTVGPLTYRIPTVREIARSLNITLLKGSENPRAVYSSKSVGEPPLCLASAAYFGVKDAIRSARRDLGLDEVFRLDVPATAERIRLVCSDVLRHEMQKAL